MLMARETKSRTAEEINKTKIPDPVVIATAFDKNRWVAVAPTSLRSREPLRLFFVYWHGVNNREETSLEGDRVSFVESMPAVGKERSKSIAGTDGVEEKG